jgi:glycosyltransferase involved in cell wall biosynthesis/SAM-dependent methyltransferase/Tfp pilus assembly protein PilF
MSAEKNSAETNLPANPPRIGFALSTKERTEFTARILPGLDCGGFDLIWCDGSTTPEGRAFASAEHFKKTPLIEIHHDVTGGPDAAIQFSLQRLIALSYDYVGLIENDIALAPGWLDAMLAAWRAAENDGFKVGAATARSMASRVLARTENYVVKWNVGAGMVLFSREAAQAVLDDYSLPSAGEIKNFFHKNSGADLSGVWELFMDKTDRLLGADWRYASSIWKKGLVSVGTVPTFAENIDMDIRKDCRTDYVRKSETDWPQHCLTFEHLKKNLAQKSFAAPPQKASAAKSHCPVCETESSILERRRQFHQCPACQCIFEPLKNGGSVTPVERAADPKNNPERWQRLAQALEEISIGKILVFGDDEMTNFLQSQNVDVIGLNPPTPEKLRAIPDGSVSGIMLVETVQHLRAPQSAFKEFRRVLADGGVIYLESSFSDDKKIPTWTYLDHTLGHCTVHSRRSLELLADKNHFHPAWINKNVCCLKKSKNPFAALLAREPKALQPWITKIDGRHVHLSEELFPKPAGTKYTASELDAAAKRLVSILAELPQFYAHFGGAGDALILLASFYDANPNAVLFSHPNSVGAAQALFDAFPKLSKIYFLSRHSEPLFHIVMRYAVYELKNCLGAGATPKFGYDEEWKASLDIVKKYRIKKSPRWAATFRKNENSERVALAPKGSLTGMVGSKKNLILPEQWPQVVAHILQRGFTPVILGTPNEAAEYPALPDCVDTRKEGFAGQMKIIGECAGLVGADSWAKSFSALAEIPTLVFEPIKGADLIAWKDPSDWVFIEPWPSIKMISSLEDFRREFDIRIAKISRTPEKSKPVIAWEGSFLDYGSLSHVNRELTSRMSDVICVGKNILPERAKNDSEMKCCARKLSAIAPKNVTVTVRHQWPPNWSRPASGALIVIQPWEFGALPKTWVEQSANVDEFWVPSPLVRHMYVESGVAPEKVRVVPNGVDTKKFRPHVAPLKLQTKKKFKFLFVGGTIFRKGPDVLLEAFSQTFTANDDVALVIKDFGGDSFYQGQTAEKAIQEIQKNPNAPEIVYLCEELSSEQMPSLYAACDCLVLPYRGEGFGMPVLEAMSCGLPVIVTARGATDYFVTPECGWKIPSQGFYFGESVGDIPLAKKGWLFEPDKIQLGAIMKYAAANPQECRRRGAAGRGIAERKFDWNDVAAEVANRFKKLGEKFAPETNTNKILAAAQIAVPAAAKIGRLDEARKLLGQKKFQPAWESTIAAIANRPFHPAAFLLLAEIALATGDSADARQCAECARELAPGWSAPKHFLKNPLRGSAKPEWLKMPDAAQNSLSVCLIVKNEEKFLARCLKSVCDIAQQIVVVDTGSTDRTVEIAKKFGAEIHSFAWNDDFAAARNAALEHATGGWILILDADEELPEAQREKLHADMKKSGAIAYRLPLVNSGKEAEGPSFIPRLFRNAPGVFYFNRIHEQVFPSLLALGKSWGLTARFGTAQLLHHGYTKEMIRDRNKIERNLKLLRQAVAENPSDANLMMNLGLELVRSDDFAAGVNKYREAFELMSAQPAEETAPELREVLLTQFTCQLYKIRAHEEVVRVLNSPLAKNGGLAASHHFALGLSHFELKKFSEAANQMRQCLAKRRQPALSPVNTDILTVAPEHCLALSLAELGDAAGAEKIFQMALAGADLGHSENVKLDYAKFLAGQNRFVEALQQLNELAASNARNVAAWRAGGEIALGRPEFLDFAHDWTGEAMRYAPEDFTVAAQRAEALMLRGNTALALELWERIWNSEREPRILAALILCEAVESPNTHAPQNEREEAAASRAFIGWYRKLLAAKAGPTIIRLNGQTDKLSRALPGAAKILEATMTDVKERSRVETV